MDNRNWIEYVRQIISEHRIHTVRVCYHDNSNIQRSRFVSSRHFLDKVINENIAIPSLLFSVDSSGSVDESIGEGYKGGYPSWVLKPDLSTFSVVPYAAGTARVIGDAYYGELESIKSSPRYILRKVLEEYKKHGITVKGAFEYEFYIFKNNHDKQDKLEPVWSGLNGQSEIKQSDMEEIFSSIMLNLTEMGAGPEVANTESGSGQFEITNSPFWGIEIADMAYYYRTSIREIINKLDLTATFMAKPIANQNGSGAHIHLSLFNEAGDNLLYDDKNKDGLSQLCRNFIGGQLQNSKALCALVNSTINSYKRLQPYTFAPINATWGYEHRGSMIRIPASRGENTRIENRLPGADTNPYICLASILAAGLYGIQNNLSPAEPMVLQDAYLSDSLALPRSLQEAINELKADSIFKDYLGAEFINDYVALREFEINRFNKHITDWEHKEYLQML